MKALFLWVYFLIVGGFIGAFYLMEYLGSDIYENEFRDSYAEYVTRIAPLIVDDLQKQRLSSDYEDDQHKTLNHWKTIVGEELVKLQVIPQQRQYHNLNWSSGIAVQSIELTDLGDEIVILSKLPSQFSTSKDENLVLKFHFVDAYSDSVSNWYLGGLVAVYLSMAVLIAILISILYRFLQRIDALTDSVAAGEYAVRMSESKIPLFNSLSQKINLMAGELQTKHEEGEIFLGAIHHELRSPLTKLRLALDMALNSKDEALLQELLTDMDTDLEDLNKLMEDILMLSRLRLQDEPIAEQRVALVALIDKIIIEAADSRLNFDNSKSIEFNANPVFLERALSNIISNGLKFAQNIVAIDIIQQDHKTYIKIADDGPGIPESERSLVFKPFYRVNKGRARTTGGVGLGLAIASIVIARMNGQIEVSDSPKGGALFTITLADNSVTNPD